MAANIVNATAFKLSNCRPKSFLRSLGTKKSSIVTCSSVSSRAQGNVEVCDQILTQRRSGNYLPPIWGFDYIQSLDTQYKEDRDMEKANELVGQVKKLLEEGFNETIQKLELIDDLQRMGISYHFNDQIRKILNSIYSDHDQHRYMNKSSDTERDLYSTALEFRLLRQHGFTVSEEIFDCFKNDKGDFKASLVDDTRGLLQLYEAAFTLMEGEDTLEQAKQFATYFLRKKLDDEDTRGVLIDENLSSLIRHALELPIHWRTQRLNARWFIDAYTKRSDRNPAVLELSKLDFNILQATYQEELKHISRWWKQTCLAEKLPFARDRLVESYFWTLGWIYEPQYAYARAVAAKLIALITVIDDIYDVYGTLEELRLFQDAIQRWDIAAIDQLPHYMQICFLALNNFINEIGYNVLKKQGVFVIPHTRKLWEDLCASYFQEAKWNYDGYTPTFEEYIQNARMTIATSLVTFHSYFLVANPTEKEVIKSLCKDPDMIRYASVIFRLADDLGTSTDELKRGDVPKAIECYMNDSGATRDEARQHIEFLICDTWKKLDQERHGNSFFPPFFGRNVVDFCRASQFVYQHGDGHGIQNSHIKKHISDLLFDPIL